MAFKDFWIGLVGLSFPFAPVVLLYGKEIIENYENQLDEDEEELAREVKEIEEEAANAFSRMDDYTFKIFFPCGVSGTGWILDYEIPEKDHYPTKWYIATNAHVARVFSFAHDDYGQQLPKPLRDKEKNIWFPDLRLDNGEACNLEGRGYFDFNLSREENGRSFKSNRGAIHTNKMKEPKLFYAPVDFLKEDTKKGIPKDNYKDFAVIEVEFTTEKYAKEATGNFYGKYGEGSKTPLGIFPWERKDVEKKEYLRDNRYTLAYPYREDDPFKYTVSYDGFANSKLVRNNPYEAADHEGRVTGAEVDKRNKSQMTDWNGKKLNRAGYLYLLENSAMKGGASGGLVIDGDGYIWGVKSLGDEDDTDRSLIVPLRSPGIIENGVYVSPAYDLILGRGDDQQTSYRQQVETHIFTNKKDTWLSQRANWKNEWQKIDNRDRYLINPSNY